MSSKSALEQSLRRLKPESHLEGLRRRERSALQFLSGLKPPFPKLLLDTTVYIDVLHGTQPAEVDLALRSGSLWHSTVTEAELAAVSGLLDPRNPGTAGIVTEIAASIEKRPEHRILNPDRQIWRDAAVLAGLLARLQGYAKHEQRKALNDALLFCTAMKYGCAVLTRNLADFDLYLQLQNGRVLFYDRKSDR